MVYGDVVVGKVLEHGERFDAQLHRHGESGQQMPLSLS